MLLITVVLQAIQLFWLQTRQIKMASCPTYHVHYVNCVNCYYPESHFNSHWLFYKQDIYQ